MTGSNEYRNWGPDEFGQMAVLCWCEKKIVFVLPEIVRGGGTASCGSSRCKPRGE